MTKNCGAGMLQFLWFAASGCCGSVALAGLTVTALPVTEGNDPAAAPQAAFKLSLSPAAATDTVWEYATSADTAREGVDYLPGHGTITIPAGHTSVSVNVPLISDQWKEDSETFSLIVWPQGSVPTPILAEIPSFPLTPSSFYPWSPLVGVSNGSWFSGLLVGTIDEGVWNPSRLVANSNQSFGINAVGGYGIVWQETLYDPVKNISGSYLSLAERQRPGLTPWETSHRIADYGTSSNMMAGDIVAVVHSSRVELNQLFHTALPRTVTSIEINPSSNFPAAVDFTRQIVGFTGRRLAVALTSANYSEINIYESQDNRPAVWDLKANIPDADLPAVLEGDLLIARKPSGGRLAPPRIFFKDEGGLNQWGFSATIAPPSPSSFNTFSKLSMHGGLLFIGDPANSNFTPPGSTGRVLVYIKGATPAEWTYAGAFSSPSSRIGDTFGSALAQGGLNMIIVEPGSKAWGGRFAGAEVTILDDDLPIVSVATGTGFEPTGEVSRLKGMFMLSQPADTDVSISWTTSTGTAQVGVDYLPDRGQTIIPAGSLSAAVEIIILPDGVFEDDETFGLEIISALGAIPGPLADSFIIRDTDRPSVVHSDPQKVFESAPLVSAQLKLYPAGSPLTITASGVAPAVAEAGKTPADYSLATPGLDWPGLPESFTANTTGTRTLPLPVNDDTTVDGDRVASVSFSLPPDTVASSFSPRLLDGEVGVFPYQYFRDISTDGRWTIAKKWVDRSVLLLYGRTPAVSGVWQTAGPIPASLIGKTTWTNIWVKIRSGRIACYDLTNGRGWVLRLDASSDPPWRLEATMTNLPVATPLDFDGANLVFNKGSSGLFLVCRGQGDWKIRQNLRMPVSTPYLGTLAHLDHGRLYYYTKLVNNPDLVGVAASTGPVDAPWQFEAAVPLALDASSGETVVKILALGEVMTVGIAARTHLFRRNDQGEWRLEQTINDSPRALGRGVLICTGNTYAETGGSAAPWQLMGSTPYFGTGSQGTQIDFVNGVVAAVFDSRDIALTIFEAGLNFSIVDEDSFRIYVGGTAPWREPASKEELKYVNLSAGTPVPVDVTIPFQTGTTGTAAAGVDFRQVQGSVVIPAGSMSASFAVPILPDTQQEPTETIPLVIGKPSYGVIYQATAPKIASITDLALQVSAPDGPNYVPEPPSGSATYLIPFRMAKASSGPLVVKFSTIARSAMASDFTVVSNATVTLPAGPVLIPVPLTVFSDALVEDLESLEIALTFVGTQVLNTAPSTTVFLDDTASEGQLPDTFAALQNTPLDPSASRNLLTNDTPALVAALPGRPAWGNVAIQSDGTFSYLPAANFIGTDRFAYRARAANTWILPDGILWKWLNPLNGVDPGTTLPGFQDNWMLSAFNDSTWQTGSGLLGYGLLGNGLGLPPDTDIIQPSSGLRYTAYLRTSFTAPPAPADGITLTFSCDDGVIFYLNGVALGRYGKAPLGSFATAADSYRLLAPNPQDTWEETETRTLTFPSAQLLPGVNTFAVSIHNNLGTSSDLGFKLLSLHAGTVTKPTYVTVSVTDQNHPPVVVGDVYTVSGTTTPLSSFLIGGSVYQNDGLISREGNAYDPILEAETGGQPIAPVTFDSATGHFSLMAPKGFYGTTGFTYRVRDKDGWSAPAAVTINISPNRSWDVWRASKIGGDWQFPAASPAVDNDGDGLANALEYVLGQEPLLPDFSPPLSIIWNGTAFEAQFSLQSSNLTEFFVDLETSTSLAVPFWHSILTIPPTAFFQFERSGPGVIVVSRKTGSLSQYTAVLPNPDGNPAAFFRIRASQVSNVLDP